MTIVCLFSDEFIEPFDKIGVKADLMSLLRVPVAIGIDSNLFNVNTMFAGVDNVGTDFGLKLV